MKKTTVTLTTPTILQIEAGTKQAIRDGGDLYILMQQEEGVPESETPEPKATKAEPIKEEAPVKSEAVNEAVNEAKPEAVKAAGSESWTESDMMEMQTDVLFDECEELGIDPNKHDGKNTNKKLRTLILDHYKNADGAVADDTPKEEPQAAPSRARRAAPSRGAAKNELTEIPEKEWDKLEAGKLAIAKLLFDDEEQSKKEWKVEIIGWEKPEGYDEDKLFIKFEEDGNEDFLREGDRLFEYSVDL
tara:strand:+ start:48223 stop:48960 length:738 start_codon:yes stop_codon:yes gene_type:complete